MKPPKVLFLILATVFIAQANAQVTIKNDKLADDIVLVLKKSYARETVKKWSGTLAKAVSGGATNDETLRANLIKIFSNGDADLAWLKWDQNQSKLRLMAAQIAALEFPDDPKAKLIIQTGENIQTAKEVAAQGVKKAEDAFKRNEAAQPSPVTPELHTGASQPDAQTQADLNLKIAASNLATAQSLQTAVNSVENLNRTETAFQTFSEPVGNGNYASGAAAGTNNIYGQFSLWTGARLSNPYTISGNNLTTAGNNSDGYIELNLSTRYILRQGEDASDPRWLGAEETPNDGNMHVLNPFGHLPDIDTRLGYMFRGSSAPTNYNASTIVGSSDVYADTSIGLPIWRYVSEDNYLKQQVTLELNGGFATDKSHIELHPNAFFGLGWQGGFLLSSNRLGYWVSRAGYAFIDQPAFTGAGSTVQTNNLGQPKFDFKGTPSLGVYVVYPINSVYSLQAGANAYFTQHDPASWNISIGVSVDLNKFFGSLGK